jgi:hypothetical protein
VRDSRSDAPRASRGRSAGDPVFFPSRSQERPFPATRSAAVPTRNVGGA